MEWNVDPHCRGGSRSGFDQGRLQKAQSDCSRLRFDHVLKANDKYASALI